MFSRHFPLSRVTSTQRRFCTSLNVVLDLSCSLPLSVSDLASFFLCHSLRRREGPSFTITPFYADTKLQNVLAPEDDDNDYSDASEHSVSRSRTPRRRSLSRTPQQTPKGSAKKGHHARSEESKEPLPSDRGATNIGSVLVQTDQARTKGPASPQVTFSAGNSSSLPPLIIDHNTPAGATGSGSAQPSPTMSRKVRPLSLSYIPRGGNSATTVERMPLLPADCPALSTLVGDTASAAIAALLPPTSSKPQPPSSAALSALSASVGSDDDGLTLRFRPTIRNTRLLGDLRHPCLVIILLRSPISGALSMTPIAAVRCATPFPLPGATGLLFPPIAAAVPDAIRNDIIAAAAERGHTDALAGLTWLIALTSAEKTGSAPPSQLSSPANAGVAAAAAGAGAVTGCERVMAVARVPARAWADRVAAVKSKAETLPTGQKVDGAFSFKRPLLVRC